MALQEKQLWEDTEKLSDAERVFFCISQLESEVNSGGFSQYCYNNSGNFASEIADSLHTISADITTGIYEKALLILGGEVPKNR